MPKSPEVEMTYTGPADELQDAAFELFSRRTATGVRSTQIEQVVKQCFRDARKFLDVAAKIATGEIDSTPEPVSILSPVRAPNLKPTHPHNMVSQVHGNLNRIKQIHDMLKADPTLAAVPDLDWGQPEVALARTIFPEYVKAMEAAPAN